MKKVKKSLHQKIYEGVKDKAIVKPIYVCGHSFTITCLTDGEILRYMLDYHDGEKINRLTSRNTFKCFLNKKKIKSITRTFFEMISCRVHYDIRHFPSERKFSRYDMEQVYYYNEFCGWKWRDPITW